MSPQHWRSLFLLASFTLLLFSLGCDEPNTPDIPPQPYKLTAVYSTPATAAWVDAQGNYVGVAAGAYGAMVFDVTNPASPLLIFQEIMDEFAACRAVCIDPVHNYLYIDTDDTQADSYYLKEFLTGNRPFVGGINFSSNLRDVMLSASEDSILFFRTDYSPSDGLMTKLMCRINDSTWSIEQCFIDWANWEPTAEVGIRGFDWRASDGMFAVAQEAYGVHLHRLSPPEPVSDVFTTGSAYDCAWFGNYIIVADRYRISIVDATNVEQPVVASSLAISGADRMVWVKIDGNYAFLLDELDGIYVVDISNPLAPKHIQTLSLPEPTYLAANNGRLYVSDAVQGLVIYSR